MHGTEHPTSQDAATAKTFARRLRVALSSHTYTSELRFVLGFIVIAGILFSLYSCPYPAGSRPRQWADSYLEAYAHLSGSVLSVFERHITVSGQNIVGRYSLRIVRGCDAIDAQILLVSAVLASSAYSWRWRIYGAVFGFLIIAAANVVRICSLYYVGYHFPFYFDVVHHELWPLVLIALAAAAFVLWSRLAGSRGRAVHEAA